MRIVIKEASGKERIFKLEGEAVTIGREKDCDLMISDPRASRHHTSLRLKDSQVYIKDLDSGNGTYLNGEKIAKEELWPLGTEVKIGHLSMVLEGEGISESGLQEDKKDKDEDEKTEVKQVRVPAPASMSSDKAASKGKVSQLSDIRIEIHKQLIQRIDLKSLTFEKGKEQEVRNRTEKAVRGIIKEMAGSIPKWVDIEDLVKDVLDEALGLGALEDLLSDDDVTEIMVNRKDQIYIEKKGKLQLCEKTFASDEQVMAVIERIVGPIGRRIDESMPLVDARLKDGSRVNAIIPPLALKGPSITIRKFSKTPFTVDDLIGFGTLNKDTAKFLEICVLSRKNIIISGGTGSGKTTLLNVVSSYIPHDERIVTIEDAAELKLPQEHVVSLEARPPNIEGKGAIAIRDLVKNALRMRPDRIVVGECRGGEALDMLQAMNTGHDGSLTTAHANSPRDVLSRLETMVLMSGMDLPVRAIREQVSSAINIIVQEARLSDGSRRIVAVTEVTGMEGEIITLQDIFVFKQTGIGHDGKVQGAFVATGNIPSFVPQLEAKGMHLDMKIFEEERTGK
ncbi:Flp pilus assembly complex ATPase component TadA [bacterium]|nr:Flp pilus assembly complex ATPase component TadA [bacterium]